MDFSIGYFLLAALKITWTILEEFLIWLLLIKPPSTRTSLITISEFMTVLFAGHNSDPLLLFMNMSVDACTVHFVTCCWLLLEKYDFFSFCHTLWLLQDFLHTRIHEYRFLCHLTLPALHWYTKYCLLQVYQVCGRVYQDYNKQKTYHQCHRISL